MRNYKDTVTGVAVPFHDIKKRGRKSGTGERKARLEIRCKPELLQVLDELQRAGWTWKGYSYSDIIHAAVKHIAKIDLVDGTNDELYQAIWELSDK